MISFGMSLQESDMLALHSFVGLFLSIFLIHHGLGVFGFRCPVSYLTLSLTLNSLSAAFELQ